MKEGEDKIEKQADKLQLSKYAFLNEVSLKVDENSKNVEDLEFLKAQKTWKDLGLNDKLIELLQVKGFKKPSLVQSKIIPLI